MASSVPPSSSTLNSSSSSSAFSTSNEEPPSLLPPTAKTCSTDNPSHVARKSRILFGSCNSQAHPQLLWPIMAARNATAFVWAGDAIYADDNVGMDMSTFPPKTIVRDATPETLKQMYAAQRSHPGYRAFLESGIVVTGAIDDHDYGTNNGDIRFPHKVASAKAYVMDFLGEPSDSAMARRAQEGWGVYGVKLFDFERPLGQELVSDEEAGLDPDVLIVDARESSLPVSPYQFSNKTVAVFVLDVRSFKTPWSTGKDKFQVNPKGDFLGERQWTWFEEAIKRSKASVNIVVQGLQVHPIRYPDGNIAEDWSKFPVAQHRMYHTLLQDHVKAPVLVSGDVHMAQLMRKDCRHVPSTTDSITTRIRPLVEVTTSGMGHSWGTNFCSRPNTWFCRSPYVQWVAKTSMHFAHWINPMTDVILSHVDENGKGGKPQKQYSLELNFAEMEYDWDTQTLFLSIFGKTSGQKPLLHAAWTFDELSGVTPLTGNQVLPKDYSHVDQFLTELGMEETSWHCVNHRGVPHPLHFQLGVVSSMFLPVCLLFLPVLFALVAVVIVLRRAYRQKQ